MLEMAAHIVAFSNALASCISNALTISPRVVVHMPYKLNFSIYSLTAAQVNSNLDLYLPAVVALCSGRTNVFLGDTNLMNSFTNDLANYASDTLHPSAYGAYYIGYTHAKAILASYGQNFIPETPPQARSPWSLLSMTNHSAAYLTFSDNQTNPGTNLMRSAAVIAMAAGGNWTYNSGFETYYGATIANPETGKFRRWISSYGCGHGHLY